MATLLKPWGPPANPNAADAGVRLKRTAKGDRHSPVLTIGGVGRAARARAPYRAGPAPGGVWRGAVETSRLAMGVLGSVGAPPPPGSKSRLRHGNLRSHSRTRRRVALRASGG
jgi:hypothetical protein